MGIKKIKNFPFEGCIAAKDNLCWGRRGNLPVPIHFFSPLFTQWAGLRLRPDGAICRRSSVGRAPRREVCRRFKSCRLHHRRDLLPRSRTERKPAKVVFLVRCTEAAGRKNLCIGWHRLCKEERMRPTYRRRAVKFRGWSGYHRAFEKSEAWMWCGGGCLRTKPLCRTV